MFLETNVTLHFKLSFRSLSCVVLKNKIICIAIFAIFAIFKKLVLHYLIVELCMYYHYTRKRENERRGREKRRSNDGQCLVYEPLKIQERTASLISSSSSSSSSRLRRRCSRTSSPRTRSRRSCFTITWSNDRHYSMKLNGRLTSQRCFLLNAHEENLINKRGSLFSKYEKRMRRDTRFDLKNSFK